jgi:hypothetical protein
MEAWQAKRRSRGVGSDATIPLCACTTSARILWDWSLLLRNIRSCAAALSMRRCVLPIFFFMLPMRTTTLVRGPADPRLNALPALTCDATDVRDATVSLSTEASSSSIAMR